MNSRFSPWLPTIAALIITMVLACAALVAMPQVLNILTLAPAPPQLPTAAVAGTTIKIPTPRPTLSLKCPNGDCANACLSKLSTLPQTSGSSEARPKAAGQGSRGMPAQILVTYPLNGDALGLPTYSGQVSPALAQLQHDTLTQKRIWDYFSAIIPADQRSELVSYIISTDGHGGMLASVEHYSSPPEAWALVVDSADVSKPRDLTFTLLHEFGHLLTLNGSQVTPNQAVLDNPDDLQVYEKEAASCGSYFAAGGCSRPDSYINQFFDRFWTKLFGEWSAVNAARNDADYTALLAQFYRSHPTQFVTFYASTSPEEDMAETWSSFVLNPKPVDDSVAHEKILFFYDYPELVDLRNQIISGICTYASTQ